jgi:hypothetical protein
MHIDPKLYTKCLLGWEGNFVMKNNSNNPIKITFLIIIYLKISWEA